jgi:hypothetical protein
MARLEDRVARLEDQLAIAVKALASLNHRVADWTPATVERPYIGQGSGGAAVLPRARV